MSGRVVDAGGLRVAVAEIGDGPPLLYLHGIADIHGVEAGPMAFHRALGERFRVLAPAHPGCAGSDDDEAIDGIDDVVFHYLRVMDALGLEACGVAGSSLGGWIAAELAVRHPEKVGKAALLAPTGLFVPDAPIADIFWHAQPDDGVRYDGLRALLFAGPRTAAGLALIPDAKDEIARELRKYRVFRFASLIGFRPPYLHDPKLRARLDRYAGPVLLLRGARDSMVPEAHLDAYAAGFPDARLRVLPDCGHSIAAEAPEAAAAMLAAFFSG